MGHSCGVTYQRLKPLSIVGGFAIWLKPYPDTRLASEKPDSNRWRTGFLLLRTGCGGFG
jgi:hypothetical protein